MVIFTSSDQKARIAKMTRNLTGQDKSHCGLRVRTTDTFEARWKVGFYPWADYQKPDMNVSEYKVLAPANVTEAAFLELAVFWCGKRYGLGQLLSMLPVSLWRKVGVSRDVLIKRSTVCSELVYRYIWALGPKFRAILQRAKFDNPDTFTPGDLDALCAYNPKFFRKVG